MTTQVKCNEKLYESYMKSSVAQRLCSSAYGIHKYVYDYDYENATSSSAVEQRPCNASCLSVVSFNSTKCLAESFIVIYIGYRFITACN